MTNLEDRYNAKKQSCTDRMISFDLSLDQWKALWKLQETETCAYLNLPFNNSKKDHGATIERIKDGIGYTISNICLVTKLANDLKNNYVFLGKDLKGVSSTNRSYIHRINKILNCQDNIDKVLLPYTEAFAKLKDTNSIRIKKQNTEKTKQQVIAAEAKKWEDELSFAKHYISIVEELSQVGVELQITLGTLKKSLGRCNKCQVSGEVFTNIEDKWLFIINKSLPVTSDNVKVTTRNVRNAMDLLTRVCTIDKLALNIHKIQNKEK